MNFEQVFDKHKEDLTQALVFFGEGVRVNKLLVAEETKRPDYYKFYEEGYEAGLQQNQEDVESLRKAASKVLFLTQSIMDGDKEELIAKIREVLK